MTDPHPLQCTPPPDVMVSCDSFDVTLATYGGLLARSCKADSLEILVDYTQFDTACRHGQIIRNFRLREATGDSVTCTQRINVQNFQDYYVRFPDDVIVTNCTSFDYHGDGAQETVINSNTTNLPLAQQPASGTLFFDNANTPNYSGGTVRTFDQRAVAIGQKYRFALQTTINNHRKTAWVRWNTQVSPLSYQSPQLPRGQHRITWFALQDYCCRRQ